MKSLKYFRNKNHRRIINAVRWEKNTSAQRDMIPILLSIYLYI